MRFIDLIVGVLQNCYALLVAQLISYFNGQKKLPLFNFEELQSDRVSKSLKQLALILLPYCGHTEVGAKSIIFVIYRGA